MAKLDQFDPKDLQTRAVIVDAFEKEGFLFCTVEIFIEVKATGEVVKVLTRSPLPPAPTDATIQDLTDLAGALLEAYIPPPSPTETPRTDLVGEELKKLDGIPTIK